MWLFVWPRAVRICRCVCMCVCMCVCVCVCVCVYHTTHTHTHTYTRRRLVAVSAAQRPLFTSDQVPRLSQRPQCAHAKWPAHGLEGPTRRTSHCHLFCCNLVFFSLASPDVLHAHASVGERENAPFFFLKLTWSGGRGPR